MNKLIIVTGPSASGKTSLVNKLHKHYCKFSTVISQDSYYINKGGKSRNFDHPSSIEFRLLIRHIKELLYNNGKVSSPVYDYNKHLRTQKNIIIHPNKFIILEGTLLLSNKELIDMGSLVIYCDVPLDICLLRRIKRDLSSRGRNLDSILSQYINQVRPMYLRYIYKYRKLANVYYDGNNYSDIIKKVNKLQ